MDAKTRGLATAAIVAAAYGVLTVLLAPISYGSIQFRLSEALCILPFFIPGTAWGLFAGCMAANLLTGNVFDIIFGSLATLGAAGCTAAIGKRWRSPAACALACLMPVLFNGLVIGAVISRAYNGIGIFAHPEIFALNAATVAAGEAAVMFFVGFPLMRYLPRKKFFQEFVEKTEGGRL